MNNNNITEMSKMMYVNSWYDSISKERSKLHWYRQALAKLEIEIGRYCRLLVPRKERLCKFCSQNICVDECHFLISCDFLNNERSYIQRYYGR